MRDVTHCQNCGSTDVFIERDWVNCNECGFSEEEHFLKELIHETEEA